VDHSGQWAGAQSQRAQAQIIVAGSGWDDNVANVASSWPDLMMEIHNYANNGPTTQAGWKSTAQPPGNAVSRTIVGEWAGQLNEDFTTGIDGNADKSFIVGTANTIYDNKMGSCWWAGAFARVEVLRAPACWFRRDRRHHTFTAQGPAALTTFSIRGPH